MFNPTLLLVRGCVHRVTHSSLSGAQACPRRRNMQCDSFPMICRRARMPSTGQRSWFWVLANNKYQ
ncbi:hypothetical protein PsYK624_155210 [Phanerochaete sordida]|uniref:Uncharacterized protein n=1 Tax=Phanerochaete sordida TaxID=48140 RepID=A0A9P3LL32_9APHY|nr:hypothetical protein PsYK624_155210 [Phanerochaete sordida]